MQVWIITKSWK